MMFHKHKPVSVSTLAGKRGFVFSVIFALAFLAGCETTKTSVSTQGSEGVSTLAGRGSSGYSDGIGSAAQFNEPFGIAIDRAGNLYVTDQDNHRIRKVTPKGEVSTLAGGAQGFADGIGSAAQFNYPYGIAIDAAGNLYVADAGNGRIRKVTPKGGVSTLAGNDCFGYADGIKDAAKFNSPVGVAIDAAGNLYVADTGNVRIRKVTPKGEVSTLVDGTRGYADEMGNAVRFYNPVGVAIDAAGNLYLTDTVRIHKVTPKGEISTLAGGTLVGVADGIGNAAQFNQPSDIAIDRAGNLYVADAGNNRIRKVTPKGEVSTLAGSVGGYADDIGSAALFSFPRGIAIDAAGNLYVADTGNHRIRKIAIE